jgi:cell wall-associated NlpC family hydrolase
MVYFLKLKRKGTKSAIMFFVPLLLCMMILASADAQSGSRKKTKKEASTKESGPLNGENGSVPFPINQSPELPDSIVAYAKTLMGTPYVYASVDPKVGFDCSGFITHVFNHFNLIVPRSSVDFTNYGLEIPTEETKPGDLILFTGTDSTIRVVGHMGIIVENKNGEILFIHSSSGHANGVVITKLNSYYQGRFVKMIRVFKV